MTDKLKDIDPEVLKALKEQVLQELDDRDVREKEKQKLAKEKEEKAREEYVAKMKSSPNPWWELVGASEGNGRIKIELDWNDAFVDELRKNGFKGESDDEVVQHYIAILARDVADDMGPAPFDVKVNEE